MTVRRLVRPIIGQIPVLSRKRHNESAKNILRSKVPSVTIPKIPFPNFIWDESCANHGDKIAIVSLPSVNEAFAVQCTLKAETLM